MTSPPPDPPTGRADAQRNRERVLEAVFALSGDLRDLSLDDIARQAGVGRSTLFRHFPTREELLLAATLRAIEEGREIARAVVADGGTAAEVFVRLSRDIARLAARFRVLHADRQLAARLVEPASADDPLLTWIVAAQARGELRRELTPRWIMEMLIALAMASADQLRDPGQDEAVVAAMLAQTLIGAFVAPTGAAGAPAGDDS
ncbi:helix-turn-helix domain-containing protein [Conexibacter stalactiti]|uniref:Helix-turn-helix domain-containing protein n=1 Tax=Conexibacter stalactiti TaxID=1940611 RepID=A0ABU4HSA9_9ACTN|nr:helix-turn-helix domain-containing protein [Conexibacter stalactiti]MDW5596217.1 helix-turn-helix domain-containing protein [Conexibacter stalactiti]MEC5036859.1 helix-turn-helix domain-containing protein [Conexibacter stalactiti]